MYTFDIVQIFESQLLAGQSVNIPSSIQDDLGRIHTASHWMFALYLVGVILIFLTVLNGFFALCFLFGSLLAVFVSFLALLFWAAATVLAQVMFTIYRNAINDTIAELDVSANLGTAMFAFSWTATLCILVACLGFCLGSCCGTSGTERPRYWRREKYADAAP